jgi:hypothetical protein
MARRARESKLHEFQGRRNGHLREAALHPDVRAIQLLFSRLPAPRVGRLAARAKIRIGIEIRTHPIAAAV